MKFKYNKSRVIPFITDGDFYYQKGIAAYQKGDIFRAKKFIHRAMIFDPDEPDYLCQQAVILAELEDYEASNHLLKRVIDELDENAIECYFFMANNYANLGRFDEALRELKTYMALESDGGYRQEAQELYRLIMMDSDDPFQEDESYVADHEKGSRALEQGQFQKAVYFFKKVIDERPMFWPAHNNLAIAYFSMGESEKSFSVLHQLLSKDPGNIHALCNLATFYYQLKDDSGYQDTLSLLDKLQPFFLDHRMKLGATYFFVGEYEKAYRWLKAAYKGAYGNQKFYYWLALSAFRIGRISEAIKFWEKVDFFSEEPFHPFDYGKIQEMLLADDAKTNPLIQSLIDHELEKGELAAKCYALFLCRFYGMVDRLEQAAVGHGQPKTIRSLAAELMKRSPELDDGRIKVMTEIEYHLGQGKPLVAEYDMYNLWLAFYSNIEGVRDPQSWAAALEYIWKKEHNMPCAQTGIAEKYGVTVYRLRQCLQIWQQKID